MPTVTQDVKRASRVITVLARNGFAGLIRQYGLGWHIPFLSSLLMPAKTPKDGPLKLRMAIEELGGAYLKFGQFLSLRPDLLPHEYCEEFRKLLDEVTPEPYEVIKKIVEAELKSPIESAFSSFDKKPAGSASIAQAHRAVLKNGNHVVVKIIRPRIAKQFEEDIDILNYFARVVEKHLKNSISPSQIVSEFEAFTHRELDLVYEGRAIDTFHKFFSKSNTIVIPQVYWKYTTSRMLVMEYIPGTKLTQVHEKSLKLAQQLTDAMFEQFFVLKTFHADPHPGNIIITPRKKLALIDFGIVGAVDDRMSALGIKMLMALVNKDSDAACKVLLEVGEKTPMTNEKRFCYKVREIMNGWYDTDYGRTRYTHMVHLLFNECIAEHIKMPQDLILLGKAAVTAEATCLLLYPEFPFQEYAGKKMQEIMKEKLKPSKIGKRVMKDAVDVLSDLRKIPKETRDVLSRLQRGDLAIDLSHTDIRHLGWDVELSSNRLSYAILTASLLVTGAMLIDAGTIYNGFSLASIILFIAAGIFLMHLIYSVLMEGKGKDNHKFNIK